MEFATEGGATDLLKPDDISGGHREGVLKYLESTLGVRQVGWRDMLIARPPRGHERGFFGLSDKAPVAIFEFQRTSYSQDGKPIRFALTVYPADRNQFELEAGRVPAPDTTAPDASASTKSSARPGRRTLRERQPRTIRLLIQPRARRDPPQPVERTVVSSENNNFPRVVRPNPRATVRKSADCETVPRQAW